MASAPFPGSLTSPRSLYPPSREDAFVVEDVGVRGLLRWKEGDRAAGNLWDSIFTYALRTFYTSFDAPTA